MKESSLNKKDSSGIDLREETKKDKILYDFGNGVVESFDSKEDLEEALERKGENRN